MKIRVMTLIVLLLLLTLSCSVNGTLADDNTNTIEADNLAAVSMGFTIPDSPADAGAVISFTDKTTGQPVSYQMTFNYETNRYSWSGSLHPGNNSVSVVVYFGEKVQYQGTLDELQILEGVNAIKMELANLFNSSDIVPTNGLEGTFNLVVTRTQDEENGFLKNRFIEGASVEITPDGTVTPLWTGTTGLTGSAGDRLPVGDYTYKVWMEHEPIGTGISICTTGNVNQGSGVLVLQYQFANGATQNVTHALYQANNEVTINRSDVSSIVFQSIGGGGNSSAPHTVLYNGTVIMQFSGAYAPEFQNGQVLWENSNSFFTSNSYEFQEEGTFSIEPDTETEVTLHIEDSHAPVITPVLSSNDYHGNIAFDVEMQDNMELKRVELWLNGSFAAQKFISGSTALLTDWSYYKVLTEDTHTCFLRLWDEDGNSSDSDEISFLYDTKAPEVTIRSREYSMIGISVYDAGIGFGSVSAVNELGQSLYCNTDYGSYLRIQNNNADPSKRKVTITVKDKIASNPATVINTEFATDTTSPTFGNYSVDKGRERLTAYVFDDSIITNYKVNYKNYSYSSEKYLSNSYFTYDKSSNKITVDYYSTHKPASAPVYYPCYSIVIYLTDYFGNQSKKEYVIND
jgi:hypothetical protein